MPRTFRSFLLALSVFAVSVPVAAVGAESEEVSVIGDSRIKESSGLVVSSEHDDLAYTINDAGNAPIVFAIRISTGDVVGTTRVRGGDIEDTESIAIDGDGTMWLSDLGDNDSERDDVALYAFPEPGPGENEVAAKRYPVTYDGGPVDIEALLVHPETGKKWLASKEKKKPGTLYSLPDRLKPNGNRAADTGTQMPEDVSDGTFTIDGSQALIRTRESVFVYDPESWEQVDQISVPEVEQGETIAMEPGGTSFLIGSEGKDSPLIRVAYGPDAEPTPTTSPTAPVDEDDDGDTADASDGVTVPLWLAIAGGLVVVGVLALVIWTARRGRA